MKYLKKFNKHIEYESYIDNDKDKVYPIVSYCDEKNHIHINDNRLYVKYKSYKTNNDTIAIYIDDFPQEVCDNEYDGDMISFKEEFISNYKGYCNKYVYTNDTFEYDDKEYYLWEYASGDDFETYLLTETLDFTGLSLIDNIENDYIPFKYILNADLNEIYNDSDVDYILVATEESSLKLFDNIEGIESMEIGGIKQNPIISNYKKGSESYITATYNLTDLTRIEPYLFYNCTDIVSVTIPKSVTYIGGSAFRECYNIKEIIFNSKIPPILDDDIDMFDDIDSVKIYVPAKSLDLYKKTGNWVNYSDIIYPL